MAEIDHETFGNVKKVLFNTDADAYPSMPEIGAYEAGVLLELVKDMLYEAYVRKGKLQQSMMDNASVFHEKIKGSQLKILKNIGHIPMLEDPKKTAAVYGAFLAGH